MKIALLSDIHSNIQALDACLAHAQAQGAEQLALLGDFVGYGGDPVRVMRRIMDLAEQGALVLRGNHDDMAILPPKTVQTLGDSTAQWTHDQLHEAHLDFLADLPLTLQLDSVFLVHATADAPALWRYVYEHTVAAMSLDAATAVPGVRYVFGGHVHTQTLYYRGSDGRLSQFKPIPGVSVSMPSKRQWLATIGSVGQPRDGIAKAMYATFDLEREQMVFHRVPYDFEAAAAAVRRAGLPDFFAERLLRGL